MRIVASLLGISALLGLATVAGSQPVFSGERALALLEQQVEFGPRVPGSDAHSRTLGWMIAFLRERGAKVMPHTVTVANPRGVGTLRLTNVKASLFPEKEPRYAFGAHWDCRPVADQQEGGPVEQPIPGANDGASGVAVLLALAEILAENPPPVGVDILLFDGEDQGNEGKAEEYALGSARFVADFPGYRPAALVLLDMVGDADLRIPMEATSSLYAADLTQTVFNRAAALGLPGFEPIPGPAVTDDHIPFLRAGIPSVDLIDMDYAHWHTLEDTPDKCSADSLRQVGTLLLSLIFTDFAP